MTLIKKTGFVDTEKLIEFLADAGVGEGASDVKVQVGLVRTTVTWSEQKKAEKPEVKPEPLKKEEKKEEEKKAE